MIGIFDKVFNVEFDLFDLEYTHEDKKGNCVRKKRKFNEFTDYYEGDKSVVNSNHRVNIFYGSKKIFVTIHCSEKLRKKFNKKLGEIGEMPKSRRAKK